LTRLGEGRIVHAAANSSAVARLEDQPREVSMSRAILLAVFFLAGCMEMTPPPDFGPPPPDSPEARARVQCESMVDEVQRTACLRSLGK
jgi:hypothetical protein